MPAGAASGESVPCVAIGGAALAARLPLAPADARADAARLMGVPRGRRGAAARDLDLVGTPAALGALLAALAAEARLGGVAWDARGGGRGCVRG